MPTSLMKQLAAAITGLEINAKQARFEIGSICDRHIINKRQKSGDVQRIFTAIGADVEKLTGIFREWPWYKVCRSWHTAFAPFEREILANHTGASQTSISWLTRQPNEAKAQVIAALKRDPSMILTAHRKPKAATAASKAHSAAGHNETPSGADEQATITIPLPPNMEHLSNVASSLYSWFKKDYRLTPADLDAAWEDGKRRAMGGQYAEGSIRREEP